MAVKECLRLMPPADAGSPARVYGSPAKSVKRKECLRVEWVPSIERLMHQREQEEAAEQEQAAREAADGGAEGEDDGAAAVHSYKKSQYWSKEIEEKLGLGGADPYGLLELEERRWRASAEEVRKAYRRLVLTMHPDKKAGLDSPAKKVAEKKLEKSAEGEGEEEGAGEGEEEEDEEFKLLSIAWDLLGNQETRRQYDSIDNFNDFLPSGFRPKDGPEHFYRVFGPPFTRQAKFSNQTPVPQLGGADTPIEDVHKFYRFWSSFSSWRDFSLLCEYDLKEAEDREERRWMQRQNKNYAARIKKDEVARLSACVQLAYDNDPRIKADKEARQAAKQRAKDDKERAVREAREAEAAARREKENAEAAEKAAAAQQQQVSADAKAAAKKEKERLRSALKKARKELKALGEAGGAWEARAADLEVVSAVLPAEELVALFSTLSMGVSEDTTGALDAAKAKAMA